jgi:hypothetical protein
LVWKKRADMLWEGQREEEGRRGGGKREREKERPSPARGFDSDSYTKERRLVTVTDRVFCIVRVVELQQKKHSSDKEQA